MLLLGDCNHWLKEIKDESIDLIVSDPPYGIEFMGKDWDKALVNAETWKECFRVLKEGKLAFVMCSPRQDVLSRMIVNLQDAGFRTNYTSIYWTFASGFPKAANISKLLDKKNGRTIEIEESLTKYLKQKRLEKGISIPQMDKLLEVHQSYFHYETMADNAHNIPRKQIYLKLKTILDLDNRFDEWVERNEAEREIIGYENPHHDGGKRTRYKVGGYGGLFNTIELNDGLLPVTKPATEEAKKMEGAYVGFQPKPAVEVILVVSKGKTLTWLDDARIPYQSEDDKTAGWYSGDNQGLSSIHKINYNQNFRPKDYYDGKRSQYKPEEKGRFPANLLVSDDCLNDGKITKSDGGNQLKRKNAIFGNTDTETCCPSGYGDSGSYSRYFSLDAWASCSRFPFLIVPKASKSERNDGLDSIQPVKVNDGRNTPIDNPFQRGETLRTNFHPTVKPLKLMSYLITMGSREGDLVLDPFCGSGTVCIAAHQLHRKWLGIEMNPEYAEIIKKRLADPLAQLKLTSYLEDEIPQT